MILLFSEHIKTFVHPIFHCANDLTLINKNEFYITRYKVNGPYDSKWGDFVEKMTHAWNGYIVYCNIRNNDCRIVAEPYSFANGDEDLCVYIHITRSQSQA
jgi:hypothetical protein